MLEINSLVISKRFEGIGCILKMNDLLASVAVGLYGTMKVPLLSLKPVDTSNCKTVSYKEYQSRIMKDNGTLDLVIAGNEVKQYVGIGWTTIRVVTIEDLKTIPRVV